MRYPVCFFFHSWNNSAKRLASIKRAARIRPSPWRGTSELLIYDPIAENPFPARFRTMQDHLAHYTAQGPSLQGLASLRASGSGQFSSFGLTLIKRRLKHPFIMADLREETHGFVNGSPISWRGPYNISNNGQTAQTIEHEETERLHSLKDMQHVTIFETAYNHKHRKNVLLRRALRVTVHTAYTEQGLCGHVHLHYVRLPITDNYPPRPELVDEAIELINRVHKHKLWIHAHCLAGQGRTTMLLCMYDMLINAALVSFSDIVRRQHMLGGDDLRFDYDPAGRFAFLKKFYEYCLERHQGIQSTWQEWQGQKKSPKA